MPARAEQRNSSSVALSRDIRRIVGRACRCATWVYVSAAATKTYPKRPAGAYCWLKATPIALKGATCDNGHPGCVSGIVNRTRNAVVEN